MSIESATAFIERLKTDEAFRDRVKAAEDKEARIALVKEEGFDFSDVDIRAVEEELTEVELDAVAGGGWWKEVGGCSIFGMGTSW